ncbi:MAG: beta-galactosidase, partial [Candidatus Omnitrophica bacterium]|nr:beta-galactosidase [Candidatus Omnitrophota bacterium]
MDIFKNQKIPPVLQYIWRGQINKELTEDLINDYLRMGFNGIYKEDHSAFGGGLFKKMGLYGFMWQIYFHHPVLRNYLDYDGKLKTEISLYGDFAAPENIIAGKEAILKHFEKYKDELFEINGYKILTSWDETTSQFIVLGPYQEKEFRNYLKNRFGTIENMNKEWETGFNSFDEISLPNYQTRWENPGLWKLWVDYHSWLTYEYFHRIQKEVQKVEPKTLIATFGMGCQTFWPGIAGLSGLNYLNHAQIDPLIINEICIADWPIANLVYNWTDRLSEEYKKPILSVSWFWPGWRDYSSGDYSPIPPSDEIERALVRILSHTVHGLIFWVYNCPHIHRFFPESSKTIGFWHNFFQTHWNFLKETKPVKPDIAILTPQNSGYFYKKWHYPKQDFGWGVEALIANHYPYTVLQEEEIEEGKLKDYKALIVFSAERVSKKVISEIEKFIDKGGYVFIDADSLSLDLLGNPTEILEKRFGIRLKNKYKSDFQPSIQSEDEEKWAESINSENPKPLPFKSKVGLNQFLLSREKQHYVNFSPNFTLPEIRTYHDILTGEVLNGEILGYYKGEVCAVEKENTLWVGTRPGYDNYAVWPEKILKEWGEPLYPYFRQSTETVFQREPYLKIIEYFLKKTKITRPVVIMRNGEVAKNIEVSTRIHQPTGAILLSLINHENIEGNYLISSHLGKGLSVWDLSSACLIEKNTDGKFEIKIPALKTKWILLASEKVATPIIKKQKQLLQKDFSPKYFRTRPVVPEEKPLPEIKPVSSIKYGDLEKNEIARVEVSITNTLKEKRINYPVIIPMSKVYNFLPAENIKSIKLKSGNKIQWDDIDKSGSFTPLDELSWQINIGGNEKIKDIIIFSAEQNLDNIDKNFQIKQENKQVSILNDGDKWFTITEENKWDLRNIVLNKEHIKGVLIDGPAFLDKPLLKELIILGDGPVRKIIKVKTKYIENNKEAPIETIVLYKIYKNQ